MGSTPSKQADDFPPHMAEPSPTSMPKVRGIDEAQIRKQQSSSPGTKVSYPTTSKASNEEQTRGNDLNAVPDAAANNASIQSGGHFDSGH